MPNKRMKILLRLLVMALVSAFVLRPVVVSIHNGALSGNDRQASASSHVSHQLSVPFSVLRGVEREAPDVVVLVPPAFNAKALPLVDGRSNVVSASGFTPPKSFLVLRI